MLFPVVLQTDTINFDKHQEIPYHQNLNAATHNDSNFTFNTQWAKQQNNSCSASKLIPCSRVLPEKLTVSQCVKKFPA
jgi:hypothetical protein